MGWTVATGFQGMPARGGGRHVSRSELDQHWRGVIKSQSPHCAGALSRRKVVRLDVVEGSCTSGWRHFASR